MPNPPAFEARLAHARPLSPTVRELSFERLDGAPLTFEAGQWVTLVLPLPEGEVRRAYSIASSPSGTPRFDLAVTQVEAGSASTYLHRLEPGATLTAIGPQGFFTRPVDGALPCPALFVGTGTGVAPLLSMLRAALNRGSTTPLCLLFGVRSRQEILYREELEVLAKTHSHLQVDVTLSRPEAEWPARRGYVQLHVRELYESLAAKSQGAPHAYVCGLERMVGAVRDVLRNQMGLPRQLVHSERYD
jgi:ferredoxin-NADP reductase